MQTMRKTGTKIFSWVLLLLLLAGLLTGCGTNDQGNRADGQRVLRYGSGDYTAINPALYEHGEINALLFAGLTAHNEKNEVVPGLAEDWSFDEKTCTYTFSLRDGLTFHDGEPLTSADVKFTLEAILDEQNGSEIVSNYTDIAEIRCPDALTVEIRLTQPNAAFPDYMTIGILPEHLLAGKDLTTCAFNQNPVGAGPYRLKDWDMGQSITMERFDNYYGGQPQIEQVIFVIVPDS
ncbi:MAG: ABC transporter substrate-binding protein, partial [Clostridia bacterium]